jgi:hypothetical protein
MLQRFLRRESPRGRILIRHVVLFLQQWSHAPTPPDPGPESSLPAAKVEFACSFCFSTCNILVNASHDRLAHQPGPLLPSYSRPHIGQTDPFGPIARRQRPLSHMQQASPDLSSRTYVYTRLGSSPPHIYGISYVLLLAAIALPALVPTASSCHSLCGHEMIYAVEQLGETNNAPRRHWALDGGVRQFHGL